MHLIFLKFKILHPAKHVCLYQYCESESGFAGIRSIWPDPELRFVSGPDQDLDQSWRFFPFKYHEIIHKDTKSN
jgi:hypothetical protein